MRRAALSITIALAVHLAGTTHLRAQLAEGPGAAESLLRRMEAAYGALQSYSDVTAVKYLNPDGSELSTVEFKIWFARPAKFRADARTTRTDGSAPKREVMWNDGENARFWATDKPVGSMPKIQIAGSGMFGTYAYHVPTLLEPAYAAKKRLHELTSATMAGEEAVEGVDCYRIRGQFHTDPYELWIGKADLLVRKLAATYAGNQMEEIHRSVEANPAIPADVFKFAPENESLPPPGSPTPQPTKKSGR